MPSQTVQWFPGHMAKTRRVMKECLSMVDISIEVLDARIPASSKNPEIKKILGQKPILTLLSKASMADDAATKHWVEYYRQKGYPCLAVDSVTAEGFRDIYPYIQTLLAEKIERYQSKGMQGRRLRAMVVGIPNVGKSTLINKMAGAKKAKAENRPGVTTVKQWVSTDIGLDLLDMPGVLWPKFEDKIIGENLAITGAIKDEILDIEEIAMTLCERLRTYYPSLLTERYRITPEEQEMLDAYDLFQQVGKNRGFLMSGGRIDERRTARTLLEEFRNLKIGRITLERPND